MKLYIKERCQSGLMGAPGKRLYYNSIQGFESLSFRLKIIINIIINKIIGVILILLSLIILISCLSYITTWKNDQVFIYDKSLQDIILLYYNNNNIKVDNLMGYIGSWISYIIIYNNFGISSYFMIMTLFMSGIYLYSKIEIINMYTLLFINTLLLFFIFPIIHRYNKSMTILKYVSGINSNISYFYIKNFFFNKIHYLIIILIIIIIIKNFFIKKVISN